MDVQTQGSDQGQQQTTQATTQQTTQATTQQAQQTTQAARPDWLPANLELDKQFLGETPSAADTISRLHNAYKGSREAISKFGAVPDKPDGYKIEGSPRS